ncbi:hypothetical protein BCR35DRAFT_313589 [Leucosporidium creatinivorum]|uniref:Uncharacterized protein n=1 Tax=Leucosporidium creatinivorum TaxID=106004 RepID=A0A1Y2FHS3_9BASI|nr:hypothetical protein BCR35DRAFT_313589 [Leucosporidium creatinivorum]
MADRDEVALLICFLFLLPLVFTLPAPNEACAELRLGAPSSSASSTIDTMVSRIEEAYDQLSIDIFLPPLGPSPTRERLEEAFNSAIQFLALFDGHPPNPPFFTVPHVIGTTSTKLEEWRHKALAQAREKLIECAIPGNLMPTRIAYMTGPLTGANHPKRPFCNFLNHPDVSRFLLDYLHSVRSQMERACHASAGGANAAVYLAAKSEVWATLDPLRRAEAVLEAKGWREWIVLEAHLGGHVARYQARRQQPAYDPSPIVWWRFIFADAESFPLASSFHHRKAGQEGWRLAGRASAEVGLAK